jgi:alpha-galactosidase
LTTYRFRSRYCARLACVTLIAIFAAAPLSADPLSASNGDAYVKHDPNSLAWAIGSTGIEFVVGFDASKNLVAERLWNPSTGHALDIDGSPDTNVTIAGDRLLLNQSSDKLSFLKADAQATDAGVQLVFTFEHRILHTLIRRTYACYSGSPTIETWTQLEAPLASPPVAVSDLMGWQLSMPNGSVHWINGLRGDNASQPVPNGAGFALDGGDLDEGTTSIGSIGRSSEAFIPLIVVDEGDTQFYGGVIWSGAWRIDMVKAGDRVAVSAQVPGTATSLTSARPLEFPHTFFGFTEPAIGSTSAALRQFVLGGIRRGRPLVPLVTYNTWYAYGSAITEADVDAEMQRAASIGVELFVLDAGWWTGAGAQGAGDYSSGLGSWTPDPDRFPALLIGLSDEAHALGMKFGIWVEPERIALSALHLPDSAAEPWLATQGGAYDADGQTAQICLSDAAARKWIFSKVANLIDTVHPDYLKWDNNVWVNCDRAGHGHGAEDGNFSHVLGLYTILDEIRQRYPDLLIENVSGGGNRLDYGMMAYTDAAWMDDLTSPSSHVRHNFEGLSLAFPPAYLLSFVINSVEESLYDPDLAQLVRSRMLGVLGLTYRSDDVDDDVLLQMATEIARYKLLRDVTTQSSAALLSAQAPVEEDGWDIVQETSDDRSNAVVFGFKEDADDGQIVVRPQGLRPDAIYDVRSIDNGPIGSSSGADLMAMGIQLNHSGGSRAHLIVISAE